MEKLTKARPPMRSLVDALAITCRTWLEADALPSPPATAEMLHATDANLAKAVEALCRAYPQQLGCERHPAGLSALKDQT